MKKEFIRHEHRKAKKLKRGDTVHFPEDRGEPAGCGTVQLDTSDNIVYTNIYKDEYVWVNVKYSNGRKALWPSNRLG